MQQRTMPRSAVNTIIKAGEVCTSGSPCWGYTLWMLAVSIVCGAPVTPRESQTGHSGQLHLSWGHAGQALHLGDALLGPGAGSGTGEGVPIALRVSASTSPSVSSWTWISRYFVVALLPAWSTTSYGSLQTSSCPRWPTHSGLPMTTEAETSTSPPPTTRSTAWTQLPFFWSHSVFGEVRTRARIFSSHSARCTGGCSGHKGPSHLQTRNTAGLAPRRVMCGGHES
mmetsp:Transcript_24180/g.70980  ORF Transcript_24180/g.70980 Transcript_24180/m.70980 type:complete len:226 (-) Transcript_24180:718-1395(-)